MANILLLGAGFTRNWGGWLAQEVLEYLLGRPEIDPPIRKLLLDHRRSGGYEAALGILQEDYFRGGSRTQLAKFDAALASAFVDMEKGFSSINFEFNNSMPYLVRTFLGRFDAIFTLNQDLLLERHYLNSNIMLGNPRRWSGAWQVPGMRHLRDGAVDTNANCGILTPGGEAAVLPNRQPYFKLHGSSNWIDNNGDRIMVAGGNKPALISRFPPLPSYHDTFRRYLLAGATRLMIIGYGFGDAHINDMLLAAAAGGQLTIFIVDPLGLDVIDENRLHPIYSSGALMSGLGPAVRGVSRRSLHEIFNPDPIEHAKLGSFLE